ncbi:hypothetical protein Tco_1025175 [Tanacetum coccineum]
MLSRKLEVDHQSDMGYELIRFVQVNYSSKNMLGCILSKSRLEDLIQNETSDLKVLNWYCLDYEDSYARGFVHRLLELQSLACLYMESDILDLID